MIIRNNASSSARPFKTAEKSLTDHGPRPIGCQRSTAHLIEPQTFFSLVSVSGEKGDNQKRK